MITLAYFMKEIAIRPTKSKSKKNNSKEAKNEAIKIFKEIERRLNE